VVPGDKVNGVTATSKDYPAIDGTLITANGDSIAVSLKELDSPHPQAILNDAHKVNLVGRTYNMSNVTMYADAPRMDLDWLTRFAYNGPLTGRLVSGGVIDTIVVRTRAGYVTIRKGQVVNGVPPAWVSPGYDTTPPAVRQRPSRDP
jgi:hypothetical protein